MNSEELMDEFNSILDTFHLWEKLSFLFELTGNGVFVELLTCESEGGKILYNSINT